MRLRGATGASYLLLDTRPPARNHIQRTMRSVTHAQHYDRQIFSASLPGSFLTMKLAPSLQLRTETPRSLEAKSSGIPVLRGIPLASLWKKGTGSTHTKLRPSYLSCAPRDGQAGSPIAEPIPGRILGTRTFYFSYTTLCKQRDWLWGPLLLNLGPAPLRPRLAGRKGLVGGLFHVFALSTVTCPSWIVHLF